MAFLDYAGLARFKNKIQAWVQDITGNSDMGTTASTITGAVAEHTSDIAALDNSKADKTEAVKSISRDGTTFTATRCDNTTFSFTQQDTTYATVSKTAAGLCPVLPDETTTTKYLRQDGAWANVFDTIYPVGAIYMSTSSTSPSTLFPGTYWKQLEDRVLIGAGNSYAVNATGGAVSASYTPAGTVDACTLTTEQIPSHTHTFTGSAVSSGTESAGHTHSVNSHSHTLSAHTHTFPAHYHTLNGHTHTVNNHTHSVGISHTHTVQTVANSYPVAIEANGYSSSATVRKLKAGSTYVTQATTSGSGLLTLNTGTPSVTSVTSGGTAPATGGPSTANTSTLAATATSGPSTANTSGTALTTNGASETHTHSVTAKGTNSNTGSGESHTHGFTGTAATINTLPPYLAVYMWERVATAGEAT